MSCAGDTSMRADRIVEYYQPDDQLISTGCPHQQERQLLYWPW
jgi:hypothetical protein